MSDNMGCEYTMDCNYPNQKLQLHQEYKKHEVNEDHLKKWQKTVNLMAKIFDVPAGLIMRVLPSQIEVLVSSQTQGNPHKPHETSNLNLGLYLSLIHISEPTRLGMISYAVFCLKK